VRIVGKLPVAAHSLAQAQCGLIMRHAVAGAVLASMGIAHCSEKLPAPLTLPMAKRPAWVREQGVVMAGDWEPLIARARALNGSYESTAAQLAGYKQEHTPEMVRSLGELGVNFIMTHGYKGGGFEAEQSGMADAKRLSAIAHRAGMHVGVYIFSGTLLPELIRREHPDSKDWEALDQAGQPIPYCGVVPYRHYLNRNHPAAQNHLKQVVQYAVEEIRADLLHFDNYVIGPGFDDNSVQRFREYLKKNHRPREFGLSSFEGVTPPGSVALPDDFRPHWNPESPLHRAWLDFSCDSLARSFYDMTKYARTLKPDILLECNPGPFLRESCPLDHGRLLRYGEAVWHDVLPNPPAASGLTGNYIRAYKTAETMDNMAFVYITHPVHAAESLAYNTDCLGCIAWFVGGKTVYYPDTDQPVSPELKPYVRFFHEKRPYYRGAVRVPDLAVLRSYFSHEFRPDMGYRDSAAIEDRCIESKIPWMPVYDHQLAEIGRFPCLSVIGAQVLTGPQINRIKQYVARGGGLIYSAESGQYDEEMRPRENNPFDALSRAKVAKIRHDATLDQFRTAICQALGREPSLSVEAPGWLTTELTEQKELQRSLVHLVNYQNEPVRDCQVRVRVPHRQIQRVVELRPESETAVMLEFRQQGDRVSFAVPVVNRYCLLDLEANRSVVAQ
jgi:hypothetical protein